MKPIKVLIVDDSAFMRKLIKDFLSEDPRITVLDTARNGKEAVEKTLKLKPDCITMDVEMPVMTGIEAVEEIMKHQPVPIIMLSSTTKAGANNTLLAMEAGAVDFIAKPSGPISLDLHKVKTILIEKIVGTVKAKIRPVSNFHKLKQNVSVSLTPVKKIDKEKIVLIGTSTGGPRALQEVIANLPRDIPAPILVVQHMPAGFTASLANRLNTLSEVNVKESEDGEVLTQGTVYIAPGGYHMRLTKKQGKVAIALDQEAPLGGHRPAVNALFSSAAKIKEYHKVAVIMTGMGSDGTNGLLELVEDGQVTSIAESEESCIVYGMPKAAVLTGKVNEVVHLTGIAQAIQNYL